MYRVYPFKKQPNRCRITYAGGGLPQAPRLRSLWDTRVFPAVKAHQDYAQWLWMFDVEHATAQQKLAFQKADRYSAAEVALMTDQDAFYARCEAKP